VPGHAKKKQEVPDKKVEFLPIAGKKKYSARSTADLTSRTEKDLLDSGYAKIGLVEVAVVRQRCTNERGKEPCEEVTWKGDLTAELLREAARSGGDLAVLLKDKEKEHKFTEGKKCINWQTNYGYRYVQNYATGLSDLVWGPMGQTCTQYDAFTTSYDLEVSVAAVWRNEPGLAERIRLAEDFIFAAGSGDMVTVNKALEAGIDINKTTDSEGSLALSRAALMGQTGMVQYLLSKGAKVNAYDRIASPLYQAVLGGHLDVVKLLLEKGAKVNDKNPGSKRTVMFAAAQGGSEAIIEELIRRKGKADVVDEDGATPLMIAASSGNAGAVRALLAAGAKVDRRTTRITQVGGKWTALHYAAVGGHPDAVRALLEGGADPATKGHYGNKPLDLALLMAGLNGMTSSEKEVRFERTVNVLSGYENGFYGYIDEKGRMVIPPRFLEADAFSEHLAAVAIGRPDKKKFGYIDPGGAFVIPARFDDARPFSERFARVGIKKEWRPTCVYTRYGLINRAGQFFVKPEDYLDVHSFAEGLAPVEVGLPKGGWGYIDRTGTMVIKPAFRSAGSFSGSRALVQGLENDLYGFIDKKGRYVVKPQFPFTNWLMGAAQPFTEGLAAAHFGKDKWGFINTEGETVIEPRFKEAFSFHEGLAAALDKKWGFIDKSGNWVIPPQFYWPGLHGGFSEGLCRIEFKKSRWGYIDKSGKTVLEPVYEVANSFKDGKASVTVDGKVGIIDRSGRYLIQPAYSDIGPFREGLAPVRVAGKVFLQMADQVLADLEKQAK